MDFKDYYATLGVAKTATEKEIKQAYRKLARKHHPDVNPGDKSAETKFKEINEAYEVLGDPEKRKKYDELGVELAHVRTGRRRCARRRRRRAAGMSTSAAARPGGGIRTMTERKCRRCSATAIRSPTSSTRSSAVRRAGRPTGPGGARRARGRGPRPGP